MYLKRISVKNIKCFEDFELDFGEPKEVRLWTALLGQNGLGKSTLLQAIAASLKPSGYIVLGGQPSISFGQKRVKAGGVLTITFEGNQYTLEIVSIDRTTFTAADGADAGHPAIPVPCPSTGQFPFVPYVGIVNGDLYALCATTEAGVLGRFDAQTGAVKGSVAVGAQPTEFAATGDGRIAVVNSNENTLTLVTPGAQLSAQLALTFSSSTSTLQDVKARGNLLYTVASGSNTVQKIDLAAVGGPKVVAEANTGTGSNPFNLEALDDDTVVVVNYATSDVVSRSLKTVQ